MNKEGYIWLTTCFSLNTNYVLNTLLINEFILNYRTC